MDQPAVPEKRNCWICFNNENNITLTTLTFERLLKNCATCLDFSIIKKYFENQTSAYCAYCFESARQLTLVKKQIEKLQKEVSDSSLILAQNILERRNRVKIGNDQSTKTSTSSAGTDFVIHKIPDPHSIIVTENESVKNESCIVSWSNELPSDSQENSEIVDFISDPLLELDADEHENFIEEKFYIDIDSAGNIEKASNAVDTDQKKIVPNRKILATKEHSDKETEKTGFAELLRCLNLPINELRFNHCRGGKSPKTVAAVGEETMTFEQDLVENKPYKCATCGQGFIGKDDLEDHIKLHNKERSYPCSVCDASFAKPSYLKKHEICHTDNRPFACSFCAKPFKRLYDLQVHENIHSEERPRPYKCSFCGKSFLTLGNLKKHEKIHSTVKLYQCSFCSKSFKLALDLKGHEAIHSEEKPYKCSFCEKSYLQSNKLKTHERVHTGERPFKCSSCSKSFTRSSSLRFHETIHSENKEYQCSFCVKSFAKRYLLKIHERSHTGERPFKCSICSKLFISSNMLREHERNHAAEERFKCAHCEESFHRKDLLTSHRQLKHTQMKEEFILP